MMNVSHMQKKDGHSDFYRATNHPILIIDTLTNRTQRHTFERQQIKNTHKQCDGK